MEELVGLSDCENVSRAVVSAVLVVSDVLVSPFFCGDRVF